MPMHPDQRREQRRNNRHLADARRPRERRTRRHSAHCMHTSPRWVRPALNLEPLFAGPPRSPEPSPEPYYNTNIFLGLVRTFLGVLLRILAHRSGDHPPSVTGTQHPGTPTRPIPFKHQISYNSSIERKPWSSGLYRWRKRVGLCGMPMIPYRHRPGMVRAPLEGFFDERHPPRSPHRSPSIVPH